MKNILVFLFVTIAVTASAQVVNLRTTKFYTSEHTSYGWTNWSNPEYSNMLVQIDFANDLVYIESPIRQLYKIVTITKQGYDNDCNYITEFRFYDQDGDMGTMRIVGRRDGRSQIYIIFGNVRWCYDVVKL